MADSPSLSARIRQLAENLEAELQAFPAAMDGADPRDPDDRRRTPATRAIHAKNCHVTARMATVGEWLIEAIEGQTLVDTAAAETLQRVDTARAESETRNMVAAPRPYYFFWHFLREWLPLRDADFLVETDGSVGTGNIIFGPIMVRNLRRIADALGAGEPAASDLPRPAYAGEASARKNTTWARVHALLDCEPKSDGWDQKTKDTKCAEWNKEHSSLTGWKTLTTSNLTDIIRDRRKAARKRAEARN